MPNIMIANISFSLILKTTSLGLLLSFALRQAISRDHLSKVVLLAFSISILYVHNEQMQQQGDHFSRLATVSLFFYCLALGIILLTLRVMGRKSEQGRATTIMLATITNIIILAIYCLQSALFWKTLVSEVFLTSLAVTIASLLLLFLADLAVVKVCRSEVLRRKLFHIGPIAVIPQVHCLHPQTLILILSVGLLLFFMLEMLRYASKGLILLKEEKEGQQIDGTSEEMRKKVIEGLHWLYSWMESFNSSRQPYFWFTHLFLIMSLTLSYTIGFHPHAILGLIAADGMAALVGRHFGKIYLFRRKTLEGTLAFALTFFCASFFLQEGTIGWTQVVCSVLCSIAELVSGDADNLVTLFVYYLSALVASWL